MGCATAWAGVAATSSELLAKMSKDEIESEEEFQRKCDAIIESSD